MKSCLAIKCARTTPVTAKGGRGDTPPRASEPRIPKARLVSPRTVSRGREADRRESPEEERRQADVAVGAQKPMLSRLPFLNMQRCLGQQTSGAQNEDAHRAPNLRKAGQGQ